LGVYPFDRDAAHRLEVTIARRAGKLGVAMRLLDETGAVVWEVNRFHASGDCPSLVSALGLSAAIRLKKWPPAKPAPVTCEPAKPPPCPEPKPCPERPASKHDTWSGEALLTPRKPEPAPTKPLERWPYAVRLGVTVGPELVAEGWASFGLAAEVGARFRAFSAGVEVHGDPSLGSVPIPHGSVSFARVSGALLLCGHVGLFTGCGVADMGRLIFPDHVQTLPASTFYGAVGVRAGLELPVLPRLFFRALMDVRAPIHPAGYGPMGPSIFQVAGTGVGLGLSLLWELPL
jgi:hypothetical protein